MDQRAKQRLTGAVILVALVVLVIPALLTGPPDTQAPAESTNEGMQEYTIDLGDPNRRAQPASRPAPEPTVVASAPPPASTTPATAAPGESARAESTPTSPATNPVTPAPTPVNPATRSAPTPAPPIRVEPARPATQQPAEPGGFVVQIGTFGSRENAERLVLDMKAKRFAAFLVPVTSNGRELYRVRVGPTRDRASAEALAADLKRAGQTGSIVDLSRK